jgi:hypothetical protein
MREQQDHQTFNLKTGSWHWREWYDIGRKCGEFASCFNLPPKKDPIYLVWLAQEAVNWKGSSVAQISFAYKFYKDDTPEGWKMSAEFKGTFCTNVTVYFVGVWDCVASVGFIPRILPFSKSPTNTISYFRHAMSVDEHRAKFKCCQWQHPDKESAARILAATSKAETYLPSSAFDRIISSRTKAQQELIEKKAATASKWNKDREEKLLESQFDKEDHTIVKPTSTDVLEVCKSAENFHWNSRKTSSTGSVFRFETIQKLLLTSLSTVAGFTGAHCDVGGGAVPNETRHMLSRIPLRWMIRQCFACNTGIIFDTSSLADVGIDVPSVWPTYIPNKVPVVGPSPTAVEHYESGSLPPIWRRSTALKADQKIKQKKKDSQKDRKGTKEQEIFHTDTFTDDKNRLYWSCCPSKLKTTSTHYNLSTTCLNKPRVGGFSKSGLLK